MTLPIFANQASRALELVLVGMILEQTGTAVAQPLPREVQVKNVSTHEHDAAVAGRAHASPSQTVFGGLSIQYDEQVLEPRDWTTRQSFWAAEILAEAPGGPVLELCAGVGHIGLLTLTLRERAGVLVDADPGACAHARVNVQRAGLSDRVEVRNARAEHALEAGERFALAIIDPPWVPSAQVQRFPADPTFAIDGGEQGLDVARACLDAVAGHLLPGGSVLLQLGTPDQVASLLASVGKEPRWALIDLRQHEDRGVLAHLKIDSENGAAAL